MRNKKELLLLCILCFVLGGKFNKKEEVKLPKIGITKVVPSSIKNITIQENNKIEINDNNEKNVIVDNLLFEEEEFKEILGSSQCYKYKDYKVCFKEVNKYDKLYVAFSIEKNGYIVYDLVSSSHFAESINVKDDILDWAEFIYNSKVKEYKARNFSINSK